MFSWVVGEVRGRWRTLVRRAWSGAEGGAEAIGDGDADGLELLAQQWGDASGEVYFKAGGAEALGLAEGGDEAIGEGIPAGVGEVEGDDDGAVAGEADGKALEADEAGDGGGGLVEPGDEFGGALEEAGVVFVGGGLGEIEEHAEVGDAAEAGESLR